MAESGEKRAESRVDIVVPSNMGTDMLFSLIISCVIGLFSWLLLKDVTQNGSRIGEPVAKLAFGERRVERKIGGEVVWSRIGAPDQIYNYDSIRTEDDSQARVLLDTGTELVLEGAALVTVVVDQKKLSVNLDKGSLSLIAGPQSSPVEVKSPSGTLKMADGGKASIVQGEDSLQVDILDGQAVFENENGNIELSESQILQLDSDGQVQLKEISFQAIAPIPSSLQLMFVDSTPVQFEWISRTFQPSSIEISAVEDFSSGVRTFDISEAGVFETELKSGIWHWRVRNGAESSPAAMFRLVRDREPEPLSPLPGSEFPFVDKSPLIRFQWQKAKNANIYNVNFYRSSDSAKPFKSIPSQHSSISVDELAEGEYFWDVEAVFSAFHRKVVGARRNFIVSKLQAEDVPEANIKLDNEAVSQYALEREGSIITWERVGGLDNYLAELSKNDSVIQKKLVHGNFIELPRDLEQGEFNLRVTALVDGETLNSTARDFVVKKFVSLNLLIPEDNARLYNTDSQLRFRWKDPNKGDSYLLEVARDKDFQQILARQDTTKTFLSIPNLAGIGIYYCRVSLLNENGEQLVGSKASRFNIERQWDPAPVLWGPVSSGRVDLALDGSLSFQWQPVRNASFYRLKIVPQQAPVAARTWDVANTYKVESDVLDLPLGEYRYSLTTFAEINGREVSISETANGVFELLRTPVQPVTKIEIF